jgi:hypothetical protein
MKRKIYEAQETNQILNGIYELKNGDLKENTISHESKVKCTKTRNQIHNESR